MERRSTSGRHAVPKEDTQLGGGRSEIDVDVVGSVSDTLRYNLEGNEEVVLNRRGIPARQRKRNRFYDDMVTPELRKVIRGKDGKKVKTKPVDPDEEDPEDCVGGLSIVLLPEKVRPQSRKGQVESETSESVARKPSCRTMTDTRLRDGHQQSQQSNLSPTINPDASQPPPVVSQKAKVSKPDTWTKATKGKDGGDTRTNAIQIEKTFTKGQLEDMGIKDKYVKNLEKKSSENEALIGSSKQSNKVEQNRANNQEKKKQVILIQKEGKAMEKEKNVIRLEKDKKRQHNISWKNHKESVAVLSPVEKQVSRATHITADDHHLLQSRALSQPQLMAVSKSNDTTGTTIGKRTAHDISIRLRNLLKLPKAHKWVFYEWFYSNIDQVLFEGDNDFQICLKESFPTLKARKMTRTEWTKVRRLLGKPRRCSPVFFMEEREELASRRAKIRQIQQRKVTDFSSKELPDEIPLQLVIGTKVTARLRRPQDGLFTGTVEGVDTSNNTYRITFDRLGLGTHSVPDDEVLSNDPPETVSTSSFALKIPRRNGGFTIGNFKFQNPALLEDQPEGFPKSPFPADGMLGGFPIRLLDMIVRLSKLLKAKREKLMSLKELNVEAEKRIAYGRPFNTEYRTRYARCVRDLDFMNKDMAMYLQGIQVYCLEITNDQGSTTEMVITDDIMEDSRQEASTMVSKYNCQTNKTLVTNSKVVALVRQLTSLMLQVQTLSTKDRNLHELKSLKDTMKDVKASLEGKNLQCFQNNIEIPMNRIISGLCFTQPQEN